MARRWCPVMCSPLALAAAACRKPGAVTMRKISDLDKFACAARTWSPRRRACLQLDHME
jgi:hypothetical protein